jgi:hypothetical protein
LTNSNGSLPALFWHMSGGTKRAAEVAFARGLNDAFRELEIIGHTDSRRDGYGHNCRARSLVGLSRQSGFKAIITEVVLAKEKLWPVVVAWNLAGAHPRASIAMECDSLCSARYNAGVFHAHPQTFD